MFGYILRYRLTLCSRKRYFFKTCNNFHIHEKNEKNIPVSLGFVSNCKKNKKLSITPPKQMQTLLFYWLQRPQPLYISNAKIAL